jgi:hypothetical protein
MSPYDNIINRDLKLPSIVLTGKVGHIGYKITLYRWLKIIAKGEYDEKNRVKKAAGDGFEQAKRFFFSKSE